MGEKTHIEIEKSTRKDLRVWKAEHGLTYDEAINRLLESKQSEDGK